MTNEENKQDTLKEMRSLQSRYIYYVIALNVAAVAYTIHHIQGQGFNWSHWLLGASVVFWASGVVLGFQFLFRFNQVMQITYNFHRTIVSAESSVHAEAIVKGVKGYLDKDSSKIQLKAFKFYKWALFSFYIGCAIFICWQVLQMIYFVSIK